MAGNRAVVIGLGGNLGDRHEVFASAIRALRGADGVGVVAISSFRETAPWLGPPGEPPVWTGPPQSPYLNGAVLVRSSLAPRALLTELLRIEAAHKRVRSARYAPRTLDLDILWIEGVAVDEADLVVPHPRLRERAFALEPLLELVPDAVDPRTGAPYAPPVDTPREG